ncbi:histidine phosphatase family protein [Metabacillus indicus]|uniref:Phosphoglycerate mutase n=1 Tax=Metabacillus indicus TaxID=246786 RepID=A0A084GW85_METID|nr:histidine phosphatase family protein [Metabacillus indicus]KEZ51597.1 phosphoglycerate mutase [Metabacillus indicus]
MEISLIRHGKSQCIDNEPMMICSFKNWVQKYDDDGVFEEDEYPSESIKIISKVRFVFTSDLKRSIQSAHILSSNSHIISDPVFREAELPCTKKKLCGLKLSPTTWTIILRILWVFGYSKNCESYKCAKNRARMGAEVLIKHAEEHHHAALVGHGFFNMMIAKELRGKGWTGKRKTDTNHWKCTTYTFSNLGD